MRFLKPLLTALLAIIAVIAGLLASVLVALTGAGVLLARRFLRLRNAPHATSPPRTPSRSRTADEPIDVVATEVPVDPQRR